MFNLKKSMVFFFSFCSSSVFAGVMGPLCNAENVAVPCNHSGWAVDAQALYLQSSSTALNTGGHQTINDHDLYENAGNNWGWGFKLEGAYHFKNSRDIDINWYHLDSQKISYLVGPMTDAAEAYISGQHIQNKHRPTWNAINLEVGLPIDIGRLSRVRLHAGVEYVSLRELLQFKSSGIEADWIYRAHNITYNGLGPRVGADMFYNIYQNFSVNAKSGVGMYAGASRENALGIKADGKASSSFISSMYIVPELNIQLGGNYTLKTANGALSLNTGWMFINYFQALITRVAGVVHSESFGFQGPYVGLTWLSEA